MNHQPQSAPGLAELRRVAVAAQPGGAWPTIDELAGHFDLVDVTFISTWSLQRAREVMDRLSRIKHSQHHLSS